jgi:hypothetical protein
MKLLALLLLTGCATAAPCPDCCPQVVEHDCYWCLGEFEWECDADGKHISAIY